MHAMNRHGGDDDGETQVHARAFVPSSEGSADAIFRSFVERAGRASGEPAPAPPPEVTTHPDVTPNDAMSLDELEDAPTISLDNEPPDATAPRFSMRWTETMEHLLQEADRYHAIPSDETTEADEIVLLTARKPSGHPGSQPLADEASAEDEADRTVSRRADAIIERLIAVGAPPPSQATVAAARMPELIGTVVHPSAVEDARALDARISGSWTSPGAARAYEDSGETRLYPGERASEAWESVVRPPSAKTQRREAERLVPDVAQLAVAQPPPNERSEDGLIPSGLLDRKLGDMAVLLRYGHEAQVRRELEQLRSRYAQDLLLARRIAEFYVTHEHPELALEQLFSLATGLFERRNVEGMRSALEQVLVIDPSNERATRLIALLEQRPSELPPPTRR